MWAGLIQALGPAMTIRLLIIRLLIVTGWLLLAMAAVFLGAGFFETATIPASQYKDPALGYLLALVFAGAGLLALGIVRAIRGKHRATP